MNHTKFSNPFKPTVFKPTKYTFLFLMLASTLILMGGAAVAPALPMISQYYPDASEILISFIITLPSLAIAIFGFIMGAVADRIGRVPVLVLSLVIFAAAGLSGFVLESLYAILICRFILGIGIAGIAVSVTSLITDYYTGLDRIKVLGYQGAAMGLGLLVLETSGGILAGITWRMAFLIYAIGIIILIGVLLSMKEPITDRVNTPPKMDDSSISPSVKEKLPLKSLVAVYATVFIFMMFFFLMPTKVPYFADEFLTITGLSAQGGIFAAHTLLSGFLLAIVGLMTAIMGMFYWRLAALLSRYAITVVGCLFIALGFILYGITTSIWVVIFATVCVGIGNGTLMPTFLNRISAIATPSTMGVAMGGYNVFINVSQFACPFFAAPALVAAGMSYAGLFMIFGLSCAAFTVFWICVLIKDKIASRRLKSSSESA